MEKKLCSDHLSNDSFETITRQRIGKRIRTARIQAGYTLYELARRSGVSSSTIHKIENIVMGPTVTTLLKIAKGLGKDLHFFLEEKDSEDVSFKVIRNINPTITSFKSQKSLIRAISSKLDDTKVEVIYSQIEKGGSSGREALAHQSEEVALCLKGRIEFKIKESVIILDAMDSVHILGNVIHRWKNIATEKTEMLFIFCPPVFSYSKS